MSAVLAALENSVRAHAEHRVSSRLAAFSTAIQNAALGAGLHSKLAKQLQTLADAAKEQEPALVEAEAIKLMDDLMDRTINATPVGGAL